MDPKSRHKIDFKRKLVRKAKEGHFILIKGIIHQEEVTIININAPNVSVPKFIKQTLLDLKAHRPNTMIRRDFNYPLSSIDISSRSYFQTQSKY
jgi:hypothetical protein